MSFTDWKNKELHNNLMEKWGYAKKEKERLNEEVDAQMDMIDYKTGQKHLPEEELEEDEESSAELSEEPLSVEAKEESQKAREKSNEDRLRETIREIIKELS